MKARILLIAAIAIFWPAAIIAQQQMTWTPVFLDPTGSNLSHGVEVWYQQGKCDNNDVVFVKIVNKNEFPVTVQWYNSVFTNEKKWIHREKELKTLKIGSGTTSTGECNTENVLTIKLSDFLPDASQFKRFSTTDFIVNKVTK